MNAMNPIEALECFINRDFVTLIFMKPLGIDINDIFQECCDYAHYGHLNALGLSIYGLIRDHNSFPEPDYSFRMRLKEYNVRFPLKIVDHDIIICKIKKCECGREKHGFANHAIWCNCYE